MHGTLHEPKILPVATHVVSTASDLGLIIRSTILTLDRFRVGCFKVPVVGEHMPTVHPLFMPVLQTMRIFQFTFCLVYSTRITYIRSTAGLQYTYSTI